jgi:hypothetical protein
MRDTCSIADSSFKFFILRPLSQPKARAFLALNTQVDQPKQRCTHTIDGVFSSVASCYHLLALSSPSFPFKLFALTITLAEPLQMQLLPNSSQDGNNNVKDATPTVVKQDEFFQEEKFDPAYSYTESLDEAPAQISWFGAMKIHRDFLFSAFTDSYATVRNGMLVVCFLYEKTWVTLLVRPRVQSSLF